PPPVPAADGPPPVPAADGPPPIPAAAVSESDSGPPPPPPDDGDGSGFRTEFDDTMEIDPRKPVAKLRGTAIVEKNSGQPDDVFDFQAAKARLRQAKPIIVEKLETMIPESVLSTIDTSHPRWAEEVAAAAPPPPPEAPVETMPEPESSEDDSETSEPGGFDVDTDPVERAPAEVAPAASPPVSMEPPVPAAFFPDKTISGASATPAFSAAPAQVSPPVVTAPAARDGAARSAPVVPMPPSLAGQPMAGGSSAEAEEDFGDFDRDSGSPWKMIAIAAALILVVGATVYLIGSDEEDLGTPTSPRQNTTTAALPDDSKPEERPSEPSAPEEPADEPNEPDDAPTFAANDEKGDEPARDESVNPEPQPVPTRAAKPTKPANKTLATRAAPPKPTPKPITTRPQVTEPAAIPVNQDGENARDLYVKANQLIQQEKVGLAIDALKDVIKLNPRHGGAY
ncbi:MAG: hypothetical protein AAFY60_01410, partial [Myxococcota bacterium]